MVRQHRPKRQVTVDPVTMTKARIDSGMSLEQVGDELGVSRSTVSRWEQGKFPPSLEMIFKLLALYKADLGFIKK